MEDTSPPTGIPITGPIDLDVFDAIRLIVPGEPCPHCHGAGQYALRVGHSDLVFPCPYCYGGIAPPHRAKPVVQ